MRLFPLPVIKYVHYESQVNSWLLVVFVLHAKDSILLFGYALDVISARINSSLLASPRMQPPGTTATQSERNYSDDDNKASQVSQQQE